MTPTETTITPAMKAEEVALMLAVSPRQVLNLQEELGAFRVGRSVRFDLNKVKAFIERGGTANGR